MNDPQGLHPLFHKSIPPEAQRGIVRALISAYRLSWEHCEQLYDERIRAQAWGYLRWLQTDNELLGVGDRFGKVGKFMKNTDQTHLGHAELHFGQIVLTAAAVQVGRGKPRQAAYRDLLAESNQLQLFQHHAKKKQIWGVILHTPNSVTHRPLRIQVGFIAKDYEGFAAELIDLKAIVDAMDVTDSQAAPRLRLRTDKETGS